MTKQEFVDQVASKSGLNRRDAAKAVDAFLESVTETLKRRDSVSFTGFGKFTTSERAAREGVNPRNPEPEGAHSRRDRSALLGGQQPQAGAEVLDGPSWRFARVPSGGTSGPPAGPRPRTTFRQYSASGWLTRHRACSRDRPVRRPGRRGGRPQAIPAAGRPRPACRPAAGRAARGRRRDGRTGGGRGRAVLLRDRRRGRAVRRRREGADRVLRGARRRRASRSSSASAPTRARPACSWSPTRSAATSRSTARAYATAFLEPRADGEPLADALTVNPYLGRDSLEPFLAACRRDGGGLFCLVKTSNAGGADVQDLALSDGRPLWHQVASPRGRAGRGHRRRARPLERRRRRRRHAPAGDRRGAAAAAAGDPAAARRRRAGRDRGRCRARVHERAGERARRRVALDHLRRAPERRRLAGRRRRPRRRGSGPRSGPPPAGR